MLDIAATERCVPFCHSCMPPRRSVRKALSTVSDHLYFHPFGYQETKVEQSQMAFSVGHLSSNVHGFQIQSTFKLVLRPE